MEWVEVCLEWAGDTFGIPIDPGLNLPASLINDMTLSSLPSLSEPRWSPSVCNMGVSDKAFPAQLLGALNVRDASTRASHVQSLVYRSILLS
jgi:hypothetical protein